MRAVFCFTLPVWWILSSTVLAQPVPSREPSSTHIFPAGGRRGTRVAVRVGAECIPPGTGFRIWGEGVTAPLVLGNRVESRREPSPRRTPTLIPIYYPKEWESAIEIAEDAPLGPKMWRLSCAQGGTATRPFLVGDLSEFIESESNSLPERAEPIALPVTVNGQIAGERDLDYFRFSAEAGQVVVFDVVAARLGSALDPVVVVRDSDGRRMRVEQIHVGSDPVTALSVPQTGDYVVQIGNVSFHGGPQYVYRMTVSTRPYVSQAFPSGAKLGERRDVQFAALTGTGTPRLWHEAIAFEAGAVGLFWYRDASLAINPVRLVASDSHEITEGAANDSAETAQDLALPATVNGRFQTAADEDWFRFTATEGEAFTLRCRPFPPGAPTLPVLGLFDAKGQQLMNVVSTGSSDRTAKVDWTAPADGNYFVRVRDQQYRVRGGPEFVYRLSVSPAKPDFSLRLTSDFANVMQGAKTEVEVRIERTGGFQQVVDLTVEGLPKGVRAEKGQIAADQQSVKIVFSADEKTRSRDVVLKVVGRATVEEKTVARVALAPHLGRDVEGVSVGSPVTEHLYLTVQHKPVFRLFCSEAYQYSHRGAVHLYEMELERLNGFEGEIQLQAGDRQNRDLDGVEILDVTVPPGVTKVNVPIYFPENMHVNAQSLTQLYTQGYATFEDAFGQKQSVLVVSEKRNLIRTLPTVVKLKAVDQHAVATPGSVLVCRLELDRTSNFPGAMEIELLGATGLTAEKVKIEAGQTRVVVSVEVGEQMAGHKALALRFRATGPMPDGTLVVTEVEVPVGFKE